MKNKLIEFYQAIEDNNIIKAKELLYLNDNSVERISTKKLATLLLFATEKKRFDLAKEIILFNYNAQNKIPIKYICAALQVSHKKGSTNSLKELFH